MILTAARFNAIGEALFGPRWKAVLARMLTRNRRMIQFYSDGSNNVPRELRDKLVAMCRTRADALNRLADELDPERRISAK